MTLVSRLRRFASLLARGLAILAGLWVFYHYSLIAFGGREKLWLFEKMEQHRYTAMAMLTGTLKLRNGLSKLGHDEQIFNGAGYTNWGFGVPLMQIPFHALAAKMKTLPQKFFPDRAIYFAYFMAVVPVIWAGFDRLLAMRERPDASKLRRHFLSWAVTAFVVTTALYPLMSCRFIIYEETICYFQLAQFVALSAYIFALRSWDAGSVVALGAAAGLGLLMRPTGLIYFGMWTVLVLFERRKWRTLLAYSAAAAPFVAFWMFSNWVRSGSPVAPGLNNSMPWFDFHTPMVRFGGFCSDTRAHTWEVARRLFASFFIAVKLDPKLWPWLDKCHFIFEDRPPPAGSNYTDEPYFGIGVLVALVWMLLHQLKKRENRLALYVPFGILLLLFGAYVWAGASFVWRYAGDFWPAITLAGVQYVRFLPRASTPLFGYPLALAFVACAYASFDRSVEPFVSTLETLDEIAASTMWADFSNSRWAQDKSLPNHLKCGDRSDWLYHDGQGWLGGCRVDTFTNFYIGVPSKSDDHYQLQFKTEGVSVPTLRVYLNGRVYTARKLGDSYVADVNIQFDRLTSPIALATIEWTREFEAPPYKLLSVLLT
jgi:hypothetical protein